MDPTLMHYFPHRFPVARHLAILCLLSALMGCNRQPEKGSSAAPDSACQEPSAALVSVYDSIRARYVASLAPLTDEQQQALSRDAEKWRRSQREDGSWADIDYVRKLDATNSADTDWGPSHHGIRTRLMALEWATAGQTGCRNEGLREAALRGIAFWLRTPFVTDQWFSDYVSTPKFFGDALVIMKDELSVEQRAQAAGILNRNRGEPFFYHLGKRLAAKGQNRIWIMMATFKRGVLLEDADEIAKATAVFWDELNVSPPGGEGIMPDASFQMHGPLIHFGGYGSAFLTDSLALISVFDGTSFGPTPEQRGNFLALVLDGFRWGTVGNRFDYSSIGRGLARPNRFDFGLADDLARMENGDWARKDELAAFRKSVQEGSLEAASGHRHFWLSDFTAHRRPTWAGMLRTVSKRTLNTDKPHNGHGLRSQHLGGGVLLLYRDGKEYHNIFPVWDWLKIPGTTAVQDPASLERPDQLGVPGELAWVGGVSSGQNGFTAMDFSRQGLAARKAWLFKGDVVVALGTGVHADAEFPVVTTINQCLLAEQTLSVGKSDGGEITRLFHNGFGYVPLEKGSLWRIETGERTGSWKTINSQMAATPVSEDVFTLWIDHGTRPDNESYAYAVLGNSTAESTTLWNPEAVRILANTSGLQAVSFEETTGAAFYQAGQLDLRDGRTLAVDQACLVLLDENSLCVANPLNQPLEVKVRLVESGRQDEVHAMTLPGGHEAGSSVTVSRQP